MPTLAEINTLDRAGFVRVLGHLFEHSPWVAADAWSRRPFATASALHGALCGAMRAASREQQLALIQTHPDLAGRLAQQNQLTRESKHEQASAGLTGITAAEL